MIEVVIRVGFSLFVVLLIMWGIARVARKPLAGKSTDVMSVVSRQQLTRNASVAVVRVADRAMIVGITDAQVSLLGEADLAAVQPEQAKDKHEEKREQLTLDAFLDEMATGELTEPAARTEITVPAEPAGRAGALSGSALSPQTWLSAVDALRERTARRA